MYSYIRPLLFKLDAEKSHDLALRTLAMTGRLLPAKAPPLASPIKVMGLRFPNRIGLAAGLDKNALALDGLALMGFGFIEVGTVTPRPQPGNDKPRLFRLPDHEAIINRLGFNNLGMEHLLYRVMQAKYDGILGINIGKNFDTPIERAADDYLLGLRQAYRFACYITVNISSPNTLNLRQLQNDDELNTLLKTLKAEQTKLSETHSRYVPLALKVAPDLDEAQVQTIATACRTQRIDALIVSNTTISREAVTDSKHAIETGGLSGGPLFNKSTELIYRFSQCLQNELPIIGVGGILTGAQARQKLEAGASLVQLYSGLIYRGPALVTEAIDHCASFAGCTNTTRRAAKSV